MDKGYSALVLRKQYSGVEDYGKQDSMPLEGGSSTPEQFIIATETLEFSIAEFSDSLRKARSQESCNVLLYLEMWSF